MAATNYLIENPDLNKIALGSIYSFESTNVNFPSVIKIDTTHFLIVYCRSNNVCNAVIGTINAGVPTYGSIYLIFSGGSLTSLSVDLLDSTHFVVTYTSYVNNDIGRSKIGIISNGNEIAFGSEYQFNGVAGTFTKVPFVKKIDATHFVVAYCDQTNSNKGTCIIGTVSSGNQIAYGLEYVFTNNICGNNYIQLIDSTHFIVTYIDGTDGSKGKAIIGTIANTNEISFGSAYTFETNISLSHNINLINSTHFIVAYLENTTFVGKAIIGTIANTNEISFGSAYTFSYNSPSYVDSYLSDAAHIVITYMIVDGSVSRLNLINGVISNTNQIAFNSLTNYSSILGSFVQVEQLDLTNFILVYDRNVSGSLRGDAILGTLSHSFDLDDVIEPVKAGLSQTITNSGYKVNGTDIVNNYMRNDHTNAGNTLSTLIAAGRTIPDYTTNYKKLGKDIHGKDGLEIFTFIPKGYAAGTTTRVAYSPGAYNNIYSNGQYVYNAIIIGSGGAGGSGGFVADTGGGGGGGAGEVIVALMEWPNYGQINLSITVGAVSNNGGNPSFISYVYDGVTYMIEALGGDVGGSVVAGVGGGGGGSRGNYVFAYASGVAISYLRYDTVNGPSNGAGNVGGAGTHNAPTNGSNGSAMLDDISLYNLIGIGTENAGKGYQYIDSITAPSYANISLTATSVGIGGAAFNAGYPGFNSGGGGGGGGSCRVNGITSNGGNGNGIAAVGVGCGGGGGRGYGGQAGGAGGYGQVVLFY